MTTEPVRTVSSAIRELLDDASKERNAGNNLKAFDLAQLAIDLARQCGDETILSEALILRSRIDHDCSEFDRSAEALQEARALAQRLENPLTEARILNNLSNIHRIQGNIELSTSMSREAYARFYNAGDKRSAAVVLANMGITNLESGWLDQAETLLRDAIEVLIELGDNDQAANFLADLAKIPMQRGQETATLEWLRQSLLYARKANNVKRESVTLATLGLAHLYFYHWKTAVEVLTPVIEQFRNYGDHRFESIALSNLGAAYLLGGEINQAEVAVQHALTLQQSIKNRRSVAISLGHLATISLLRGNIAEADEYLTQTRSIHREIGETKIVAEATIRIAELRFMTGNVAEAWRELHDSITILRGIKPVDFFLYALGIAVEFAVRTDEAIAAETYWRELSAMAISNDTKTSRGELNFASLWRNAGRLKANPGNSSIQSALVSDFPLVTASSIEFELGRESLLGNRITRLYEYILAAGVPDHLLSLPMHWKTGVTTSGPV
ncbi:MAG: tetratricopeptide repeat protein [bacterium]|nr:tetratricopeptide repeat protein [bacterium]